MVPSKDNTTPNGDGGFGSPQVPDAWKYTETQGKIKEDRNWSQKRVVERSRANQEIEKNPKARFRKTGGKKCE